MKNRSILLRFRIDDAIRILRIMEPKNGYYLAFSGGKDSTVVYDLMKHAGVQFHAEFTPTGLEPIDLVNHVRDTYPDVTIVPPRRDFYEELERGGFLPSRQHPWCCSRLKSCRGIGHLVVTGIRNEESHKRSKRSQIERDSNIKSKVYLHPIIEWSHEDVWKYIRRENLPYCRLYDLLWDRVGCVACPKTSEKIRKYQLSFYPDVKARIIASLDKVLKESPRPNFSTGEEYFSWWMSGKSVEKWKKGR